MPPPFHVWGGPTREADPQVGPLSDTLLQHFRAIKPDRADEQVLSEARARESGHPRPDQCSNRPERPEHETPMLHRACERRNWNAGPRGWRARRRLPMPFAKRGPTAASPNLAV